ncbi:putative transferase [Lupinus albus]|uniref:Putative transferase n=1 Tax=Lupinus albus TaxID=3870 RepID=A0A6A4NI36_LUPAL|nr:putative transferase [Lupinus albus]
MVDIISTSSIKAESDVYGDSSSPKIIHSTPWDLTCLPFETDRKGLIYNNPMNIEHQIQHLKQSLSSTLAFFPPLDGRLVILQHDEDNTVSSHILCNNACALFVHAVVSDNTGVKNYESTSHPLLAVQITELVDGIFIGFSMNHSVLDGKCNTLSFIFLKYCKSKKKMRYTEGFSLEREEPRPSEGVSISPRIFPGVLA